MNRDCNGDYFSVEGQDYYRCLLDGKVMAVSDYPEFCPNCMRIVDAHDLGELEAVTISFRQVTFSNGWRVRLPAEDTSK